MTKALLLKSRKQFRNHHIEKVSPRIYRRKNRQAFPRKAKFLPNKIIWLGRFGDPVPLSMIISEIMEILAGDFESSSHLWEYGKAGLPSDQGGW